MIIRVIDNNKGCVFKGEHPVIPRAGDFIAIE